MMMTSKKKPAPQKAAKRRKPRVGTMVGNVYPKLRQDIFYMYPSISSARANRQEDGFTVRATFTEVLPDE